MKIIKYSKSYHNVLRLQKNYLTDNDNNLKNELKINKKYIKQKKRKNCKNCLKKLTRSTFKSFEVKYSVCQHCGHLNGIFENTKSFTQQLYTNEKGSHYDKEYSNDFKVRVKNIYAPKIEFLKQVIKKKLNIVDIGSGAGHFLKACENVNISARGYEISKYLVSFASSKLKKNSIKKVSIDEMFEILENERKANIVSLIGVLEHFYNPGKFFESFSKSKVKYLYLAVPLFSLSVFLENAFPKVYPRQLSGDHTHLYTKESLDYLAKKNNLKIIGEWWFGADIPDLCRSLIISSNHLDKKVYMDHFNKKLNSVVDQLQNVLDRNKICSEVHMVFKKNG